MYNGFVKAAQAAGLNEQDIAVLWKKASMGQAIKGGAKATWEAVKGGAKLPSYVSKGLAAGGAGGAALGYGLSPSPEAGTLDGAAAKGALYLEQLKEWISENPGKTLAGGAGLVGIPLLAHMMRKIDDEDKE